MPFSLTLGNACLLFDVVLKQEKKWMGDGLTLMGEFLSFLKSKMADGQNCVDSGDSHRRSHARSSRKDISHPTVKYGVIALWLLLSRTLFWLFQPHPYLRRVTFQKEAYFGQWFIESFVLFSLYDLCAMEIKPYNHSKKMPSCVPLV